MIVKLGMSDFLIGFFMVPPPLKDLSRGNQIPFAKILRGSGEFLFGIGLKPGGKVPYLKGKDGNSFIKR